MPKGVKNVLESLQIAKEDQEIEFREGNIDGI